MTEEVGRPASALQLKVGLRLRSQTCGTEVIVVRAPSTPVDLQCGGLSMVEIGTPVTISEPTHTSSVGNQIGKRYVDSQSLGLEVLVTKPGNGQLAVGETALEMTEARKLPASD